MANQLDLFSDITPKKAPNTNSQKTGQIPSVYAASIEFSDHNGERCLFPSVVSLSFPTYVSSLVCWRIGLTVSGFDSFIGGLVDRPTVKGRVKQKKVLLSIISGLVDSVRCASPVTFDFRAKAGQELKAEVIKLAELGLCELYIQPEQKKGGARSFALPSSSLQRFVRMHLVSPTVTTDFTATELARTFKDKKGNKVRQLLMIPDSKKAAKIERDNLELAADHSGLAAKFLPSIGNVSIPLFIVRKYSQPSESKAALEHGGRWYCDWQQLPSEKRKQIRFKRSLSAEIDFTAMHLGLLYALAGKQIDWTVDPYQKGELSKYPRKFVKLALLRLFNSESLANFKAVITLSGKADTQRRLKLDQADYKAAMVAYGHLAKQGFTTPPRKPELLDIVIEKAPIGVTGEKLLNDIREAHSDIENYIGQPDLGIKLQWLDSEVMTDILTKLTALGIPSIPVHDSVVVPKRDQAKAAEIMLSSYEQLTGFKASIG